MNEAGVRIRPWHRWTLAAVSGALLALSFPKNGVAGLAWVAPGLMLLPALGRPAGEAWRLGYLAGLVHYLISLRWILQIPYRWHEIPFAPAAGWFALSAFMALYLAGWVWLVSRGISTTASDSSSPQGVSAGFLKITDAWTARLLWALSGGIAWVGMEMIAARFLSGFPWNLLGSSQYQMLPLIQIASVTGIYGVSFLPVWFSLALLCAVLGLIVRPGKRGYWIVDLILPVVVLAGVLNFGMRRAFGPALDGRELRVAMVQPSIPQSVIWDEAGDDARFAEIMKLSNAAATNHPDLILWPEAAVPKLFRYYDSMFQPVTTLARSNQCWVIIGADDMEPAHGAKTDSDRVYFNASFLINPEGDIVSRYCKRRLVIFGEYLPTVFKFMKHFLPIQDGFTPGSGPVTFHLKNPIVNAVPLICFEDIFPHLTRRSIGEDTDVLINLTNNGWFGEDSAQWQHAAGAVFRAVENGLPLLRCSNNGLTCWVDSRGRIRDLFRDSRGSEYGAGILRATIPLPVAGHALPTFYSRNGDVFGWACITVTVLMVGRAAWGLRRRTQTE